MDHVQAIAALRATGDVLQGWDGVDRVTIILGGAVAAMVVADRAVSRVTHDCDVLVSEPDALWETVYEAAQQVAEQEGLPTNWLNRDSRMYAHLLPVGWRRRCAAVGDFGPLRVLAIGRRDLMAMKLLGASVRPQDLEDIEAMRPTREEIGFLREHLGRLESESLARETYDDARAILKELESIDETP